MKALFGQQGSTKGRCRLAAKTESRDEGGPRSGGRVLTQIQSPIHESACPCDDDAGLMCNVLGLRNWDSDNRKNPATASGPISAVRFGSCLALLCSQHLAGRKGPPLRSGGLLHSTANRLFLYKNQQDSAATAGVLRQASPAGLSDARRMEGVIVELWRLTTTRQMMVLLVRHSK